MPTIFPGIIMGFREGLEAFLIVTIILRYLSKSNQTVYKKHVWQGVIAGIVLSLILGFSLNLLSDKIIRVNQFTKIWESVASLAALLLVTTFIFWMIKHGRHITAYIEDQVSTNVSKWGVFFISLLMVSREGTEIAIFTFAGQYTFGSISLGILGSLILTILIFYSLVKVNLKTIFNITLIYLVLQAGFLLGYTIHEGLSAMKEIGYIAQDNILLIKAFDLSGTVFYHKEGIIGIPLYVLFGWHSEPEWIQFLTQYFYTIGILIFWNLITKKK
jgi:high-affinity iron transporter